MESRNKFYKKLSSLSFGILGVFLVMGISAPHSKALVRLGVLGGANLVKPTFSSYDVSPLSYTVTSESQANFIMGAFGEISFLGPAIELGVFYTPRNIEYKVDTDVTITGVAASSSTIEASYTYLTVPLLFRYWLLDTISVGAGGYWGTALNEKVKSEIATTSAGGTTATITNSETDIAEELKSDWGLMLAAGLAYKVAPMIEARLDARYAFGLDNHKVQSSGATVKFRDIQILAGINFKL